VKMTLEEIYQRTKDTTDKEKVEYFFQYFPENQARALVAMLIIQPTIRRNRQ